MSGFSFFFYSVCGRGSRWRLLFFFVFFNHKYIKSKDICNWKHGISRFCTYYMFSVYYSHHLLFNDSLFCPLFSFNADEWYHHAATCWAVLLGAIMTDPGMNTESLLCVTFTVFSWFLSQSDNNKQWWKITKHIYPHFKTALYFRGKYCNSIYLFIKWNWIKLN